MARRGRPPKNKKAEEDVVEEETALAVEEEEVEVNKPQPAPFLESLLTANKKQFGRKGGYVGSDRMVIGLEPYALALQYLMDLQVIPLQSIITLSGEAKTYKTSALLELLRIYIEARNTGLADAGMSGMGIVIHTEGKWSNSKARSMMGPYADSLITQAASSVEEWNEFGTANLNHFKEFIEGREKAETSRQKTSKYFEYDLPCLGMAIDSMTGSQSEAIKEKVQKEGHGGKTYQDRAMIINQWLKTWGSDMLGIPATVFISQHLQPELDPSKMAGSMYTPGGVAGGFHTSLEIRVKKIRELKKADSEGATLQWQAHFNSLGRDKRRIHVDYIEGYDDDDNQIAHFDWDKALVDLIVKRLDTKNSSAKQRDRILNVLGDFSEYSKPSVGKVYKCEALGIDKSRAMDENIGPTELGQMLQAWDSPLREQIRTALYIQPAQQWTLGTKL